MSEIHSFVQHHVTDCDLTQSFNLVKAVQTISSLQCESPSLMIYLGILTGIQDVHSVNSLAQHRMVKRCQITDEWHNVENIPDWFSCTTIR